MKSDPGDPAEKMTDSYLETALWLGTDDRGRPFDQIYTAKDFAPEAREKAHEDCRKFWDANKEFLQDDPDHAGHYFYLTRNGAGVGFWSGRYGEAGEILTVAARRFGESSLYEGDDGNLYFA